MIRLQPEHAKWWPSCSKVSRNGMQKRSVFSRPSAPILIRSDFSGMLPQAAHLRDSASPGLSLYPRSTGGSPGMGSRKLSQHSEQAGTDSERILPWCKWMRCDASAVRHGLQHRDWGIGTACAALCRLVPPCMPLYLFCIALFFSVLPCIASSCPGCDPQKGSRLRADDRNYPSVQVLRTHCEFCRTY